MDITPETVAEAVNKVASARGKGTLPNIDGVWPRA